ncbi:alanine racemase [bacterium]|nr:alanine racemase [bacterium]
MSYCWAEIDLNAIIHNLKQIQRFVGENVKVMAVVKADAYGHGIEEVAKAISSQGNFYFGVSSLQEGIKLREAGIKSPIVNLLPTLPEDIKETIHWNITPIISNGKIAHLINEESKRQGRICPVHIKIDTGMGRLGISPDVALDFVLRFREYENLSLEGIYTHFASADSDLDFTKHQLSIFLEVLKEIRERGIEIPLKHCANSAAIFSLKDSHLDMVRPGIALYGINPTQNGAVGLLPAMSVKAKVIEVKDLPAGHSISYGRTYILPRKSRVAVIGIGYAQGFFRSFSNKGNVLIKGKRAPILGVVCMDQMVVDVSEIEGVELGEEVVIMGRQGEEEITPWELAKFSETIPYEILTSLGHQLPRAYKPTRY